MPITFTEEDFKAPVTFSEADFQDTAKSTFAGLPNQAYVEKRISQREPYYKGLVDVVTKQPEYVKESLARGKIPAFEHPFQTALDVATVVPRKFLGVPLQVMASGQKLAEGVAASAGLALQRGKPGEILPDVFKTIQGERQAELGDIPRAAGVPAPVSSAIGLLSTIGLFTPTATLKSAGRMITAPGAVAKEAGAEISAVSEFLAQPFRKVIETTKSGFQTLKGLKLPTVGTLEKEQKGIEIAKGTRLSTLQLSEQKARFNLKESLNQATESGASKEDLVKIKLDFLKQAEERQRQSLLQLQNTTKQIFENNKKVLDSKFQDINEDTVLNFQKHLPEYFDSVGETYGNWQDNIAEAFAIKRGGITANEASGILNKSIIEIEKDNLGYGQAYQKILALEEKYTKAEATRKTFDLKEVKADFDQVFKTVKYGQRGKSLDIPAHILRKHWGEFTGSEVEGYADLQKFYAESIEAMKLSDKLFKPGKGELYTKEGIAYLRAFGLEAKPSLPQRSLISTVESGTKEVPGVGNITKELRMAGEEIRNLEATFAKSQLDVTSQLDELSVMSGKQQQQLIQELKQVMDANGIMKDSITQRINNLGIRSTVIQSSVRREFNKRIDELSLKILDRKKAVALARMLGLTAAGGFGAYKAGSAVMNIAGFGESYGPKT